MSKIYLGTTVAIEAEVKGAKTGEFIDVGTNLLRILRPNGDLDEPSLKHASTGKYEGTYDPGEVGSHKVVFIGRGDVKVTGSTTFRVHDPGASVA